MVRESRFLPNNKTFPVVELLTKSSLVNKTADTSSTGGAMLLREYSIYTRTRAVHCELIRSPWKRTTTPFSNLNKEMWNKDNERNLVLPVLSTLRMHVSGATGNTEVVALWHLDLLRRWSEYDIVSNRRWTWNTENLELKARKSSWILHFGH